MTTPPPVQPPARAPVPPPTEGQPGPPWVVGRALVSAAAAGLVLLTVGVLAGRPDVALLGAGPVVMMLGALWNRQRGEVWVDVVRLPTVPGELAGRVHLTAPPGTTAVRLRVSRPGHGITEALVHVPGERALDVRASSVRTGPQRLFRVEHQGLGGTATLSGPPAATDAETVLVLPAARQMPALPMPTRLRGLTGQHDSRRPGEGGGLRDVHPFSPGDNPRLVDWKVTARRSPRLEQLYVRRTMALGEASVMLVVDSRDDVGPDPLTWSGMRAIRPDDATSLDLARQAAATVAQGYLTVGDRVGVTDLGVRRRALRPGTGRRHLNRVLHQLALLHPEGDPPDRVRPPRMTSGSMIYLFSTFLDPEAAEMARAWRRMGQRVIAVDVLPRIRTRGLDAEHWLALRIARLARDDRLADLAAVGVEVLHWADVEQTTATLQLAARRSHSRRDVGVPR